MFDVVLLLKPGTSYQKLKDIYPLLRVVEWDGNMTREIMKRVLSKTFTRYFYILSDPTIEYDIPDLTPDSWDAEYVHVWNNDARMSLYNRRAVTANIDAYLDNPAIKNYTDIKISKQLYDVVFLSYDEECANKNYTALKSICPRAKRVSGVKGIFNAHQAASNIVNTSMFFVVDADAVNIDPSVFDISIPYYDMDYVHIWRSKNPLNSLVYGYGGVKLFPRDVVREAKTWTLDFTTTVASGVKVIEQISNTTGFNHSPLSTWRSAFRECVKLSSATDINHEALLEWTTKAKGKHSDYALDGAKEGKLYGSANCKNIELLSKINDYVWLKELYDAKFQSQAA